MLLGMFSKRITSAGAFYGLLLGMITSFSVFMGFKLGVFGEGVARILCFSSNPSDMARNLWQAWWAFFVCFVATAVISMFTKPKPPEELKGLVSGLTERAKYEGLSWFQKPAPWALLSLLVLVLINIVFF
jgi:SSS family solute:Na+ symporter